MSPTQVASRNGGRSPPWRKWLAWPWRIMRNHISVSIAWAPSSSACIRNAFRRSAPPSPPLLGEGGGGGEGELPHPNPPPVSGVAVGCVTNGTTIDELL